MRLVIFLITVILFFSCAEHLEYKNNDTIVMIKCEEARKDGSLYLLPYNDYIILRNKNSNTENTLISAITPLVIKEKEINAYTIKYCLNRINDYYPLNKTSAICNYSNRTIVEDILSNMEKPIIIKFRDTPIEDIEFFIEK